MKLCDYAKKYSVTYRTAWNRFNAGKIPNSFKDKDGHILIEIIKNKNIDLSKVAIYARVSSSKNKANLDKQATRLTQYSIAKGYQITEEIIKLMEEDSKDDKNI